MRDHPSRRELLAGTGLGFGTLALAGLLADEGRRAELVAAGHLRRARFRWETTVEDIVALYRRAAEAR